MDEQELFDSMASTLKLLMGSKQGRLQPPVTIRVPFKGEKAEAMGSARHIASKVADNGYETETEYVEEIGEVLGSQYHRMRITVTDE